MNNDTSLYQNIHEDMIPENKFNWLIESNLISNASKTGYRILYVGCSDGLRYRELFEEDDMERNIVIDSFDISDEFVEEHINNVNHVKRISPNIDIRIFLGDITNLNEFRRVKKDIDYTGDFNGFQEGSYDLVLCLNNTFGYIADEKDGVIKRTDDIALKNMVKLLKNDGKIILSTYGTKFLDMAERYFKNRGFSDEEIEVQEENNLVVAKGWPMRVYTEEDIKKMLPKSSEVIESTETPMGNNFIIEKLKN